MAEVARLPGAVVWSEERDAGDMYKAEVGVVRVSDSRFHAFVRGGWGGGLVSKAHPGEAAARADIGRLWEKYYG
jgi:hypothetical protein